MSQCINVIVGSANQVKVSAVRLAFEQNFPACTVSVSGTADAPSGVSDQPFGDQETRQGAINRCKSAAGLPLIGASPPDYSVGLEGGVEDLPVADLHDGDGANALFCSAWMAVMRLSDGYISVSRTATFQLPAKVTELIRQGVELGDADDRVLRKDGSTNNKQKGGTVGILTNDAIDRTDCE